MIKQQKKNPSQFSPCQGRGRTAFTLVELIVVITILAILGAIAFISLQGYSSQSRDSTRISDLSTMKTSLELFHLDAGKYPIPTDGTDITYSGGLVWTQGIYGDSVFKNVDKLDKIPSDPLVNSKYTYSVTATKNEYELSGVMEGDDFVYLPIQTNAGTTEARAIVTGNYNGQMVKSLSGSTTCNILAIPSIITTDTSITDLETITSNESFVYNGFNNLPSSYKSSKFKVDGGFDFKINNLVAYTDTGSCTELTSKSSYDARVELIDGLQKSYSGTTLKGVGKIKRILALEINTSTPSVEVQNFAGSFVNNNLGGEVEILSNSNQSSNIGGNDSNTVLLLHNNKFDSSSSSHLGNFHGDISISNSTKKFGYGSYSFDGTGDYISLVNSTEFNFGSGDFTVDLWAKSNLYGPNPKAIIGQFDDADNGWFIDIDSSGYPRFVTHIGGSWGILLTSNTLLSTSDFDHLSVVRSGNTFYMFLNGVQVATTSNPGTILDSPEELKIGYLLTEGATQHRYFDGFIDEIRISKGIARWTSNYSTNLPGVNSADTYTKLLIHPIGDVSLSNNDISLLGISSENIIGKFNGSYNFDGTNDYISISDSNDWDFGSGDFTMDLWVRTPSVIGNDFEKLITMYPASETDFISLYLEGRSAQTTEPVIRFSILSSSVSILDIKEDISDPNFTTWQANTWYHIAIVRDGDNFTLYRNGVALKTLNASITLPNTNSPLIIGGRYDSNARFNGYMDEIRISKGIARWTSDFTPYTIEYSE